VLMKRKLLLLLFTLYIFIFSSFAEGSVNLYPNGCTGKRAYLLCRNPSTDDPAQFNVFPTQGTVKVYAKAGETLYVGSSVQGRKISTTGTVNLRSPNGNTYTSGTSTTVGLIANRTQELNGPKRGTHNSPSYYTPYTHVVTAAEEGIWEIDFIAMETTSTAGEDILADSDWSTGTTQTAATTTCGAMIAAFDVSVGSASDNATLVPGRLYTNLFNGSVSGGTFTSPAGYFYGTFYVLTNTGYTYKVQTNGQNGYSFGFFANNKGIQLTNGTPIVTTKPYSYKGGSPSYLSKNFTGFTATAQTQMYDPREPDNGIEDINHKLFFAKPGTDLPLSASISYNGKAATTTWLKTPAPQPKMTNLAVIGAEGSGDPIIGPDGTYITFTSNVQGSYVIWIDVDNNGVFTDAVDRKITGDCDTGFNSVGWDGKDGNGTLITSSKAIALQGKITAGEVHFPLTDVEVNPNGMIVELTSDDGSFTPVSGKDIVYWNDTGISKTGTTSNPINESAGVSSNTNGHKWGTFSTNGTNDFGNQQLLDTWAYVPSDIASTSINVEVKKLDLAVNSITPDNTSICIGSPLTYTIEVENINNVSNGAVSDAVGAAFAFTAPPGFNITSHTFTTSSGTAAESAVVTSGNSFSSNVNLSSGGKITYTITGNAGSSFTNGSLINATATIMRPADVTDVDATSTSTNGPPTDPQLECDASPSGVGCNNIKTSVKTTVIKCADLSINKVASSSTVIAGQSLSYTITVTNNGYSAINNSDQFKVTDVLPSGFTATTYSASSGTYTSGTGVWTGANIPSGGSVTLTIAGTVSASATGSLSNTATVEVLTGFVDPTLANNTSAQAFTTINREIDLSISKTAAPTVIAGNSLTYIVTVTNNGPSTIIPTDHFTINDVLPGGFTATAFTPGSGTYVSGSGDWTGVTLATGQSVTLTIAGTVNGNATGSISNTASVTVPVHAGFTDPTPGNNTSSVVTTTINRQTDLSITKSAPASVVAGQALTYTITVTNHGSSMILPEDQFIVSDALPGGFTAATYTPSAGTYTPATGIWTGVTINCGGSVTLTIAGTVNGNATDKITNTASVTAPIGVSDPDGGNNISSVITTITRQADLSITKSAPATVTAGGNLNYVITVTNNGPSSIIPGDQLTIKDVLPANFTATGFTPSSGSYISGSGAWTGVTLPTGASVTLTIAGTVNASATDKLSNTASVSVPDDITDLVPGNNKSTAAVTSIDNLADLSITKSVSAASVIAGQGLTYTISVTNNGPSTIMSGDHFTVTDVLPTGFTATTYTPGAGTYVSASGDWTGVTLATGQSVTLTIAGTVNGNATGSISNTASVKVPTGFTDDPTPGNNSATSGTTTINRKSDLSISKSAPANVAAGQNLSYTITVGNNGPSAIVPGDLFTVVDDLPGGYTPTSYTASAGTYDSSTGAWTGVSLPNGGSITLTIDGKVNAGVSGTLENTVYIISPDGIPDPDNSNNTAKVITATCKQTDLSVVKTVSNANPAVGSTVTFTIVAKNNGPSNATGVNVNEVLSSGYSLSSMSYTKGSWSDPIWNVGNLASGATETLTVIATVNGSGTYTNTATISGTQTDPESGNNSSTCTPEPKPVISINNPTANEGSPDVFTVGLSLPSSTPVIFTPIFTSVTATVGADTGTPIQYSIDGGSTWNTWISGDITIPVGVSTVKISVPTVDDNIAEQTETFTLTANVTSGNTTNGSAIGTGTILDNDVTSISVSSPTVVEGADEEFTINLSNPSSTPVNVTPTLTSITAIVGVDTTTPIHFSLDGGATWIPWISGDITIPPGITVLKICVPTVDDNIVEPTETYKLTITVTSGNTTNGSAFGIGTITDNDATTLNLTGFTVTETDGSQTQNFVATLDKAAEKDITLSFSTSDDSALAGSDYTSQTSSVITIPAGSTSVNIPVEILGDLISEPTETFKGTVTLSNGNGQTITLGTLIATATIIDNDALSVSINDVTVNENGGNAIFTVTLNGSTQGALTVDFSTANNTAIAGSDYTAQSGTVTFPAGSLSGTTKTITVPILDDNISEPTETFYVNLNNLVSGAIATISDNQGVGTITDNDVVALDDNVTTNEDTSIKIAVLANDVFASDNVAKVTNATSPNNGVVVINSDGTITYTPNPDFNGIDTFNYTVTITFPDNSIITMNASVTVTVTPVADIKDDSATTLEDTPVTISVLSNDGFSGTNHAVTGVSTPANGSVVINADGTITYTPNADFNGTDTFTYTVTVTNPDGTKTTETGTVTVTVTPVTDIKDDSATTLEDTPVTIPVLSNDGFSGTNHVVTGVSIPANGSVVINADGTVTYTPHADFNGTDTFTYTVTVTNPDGTKTTETGTVTVTVTPVTDIKDDSATTLEDTPVTISVLSNDGFSGTNHAVTGVSAPANGSVVINANGTVTYTPNADFNGTDTFTYTVTVTNQDGTKTTETGTVTVTVTPVTDIKDDSATTLEDTPVTIPVLSNDGFSGTNHAITGVSTPANGSVVINADGTVTYTPNADFNGTDTFTYTVTVTNQDGTKTTETGTVTVTVTPVTDIKDDSATTLEDTPVTISVLSNDGFSGTNHAVIGVSAPANGSVIINADGTVTYTPNADFNGTDTFTYTVTVTNQDGTKTTETGTVTVTVTPVTDIKDDSATTLEDTSVTIPVLSNDGFSGTNHAVTGVSTPANGNVVINADGTITYTPNADFNGTDTFTYTVTVTNPDGTKTTETGTVTVTVTPVADIKDDSATTLEDTPVTIPVLSNDGFSGTNHAVTGVSTPANGSVVINADGTVTYTPNADFNGTDTFTYTVTVTNPDGTKTTETGTVTVTVTSVTDIKDDSATTLEDTSVTISVLSNDGFSGTNHAVTGVSAPANGSVVINADGTIIYTPNPDFNGIDTFTYTVTVTNQDGTKTTETGTVTVTVTPVNDAPVGNDISITTPENTPISGTVKATDVDGNILIFNKATDSTHGTVVVNSDGTYTYTPDTNYIGLDSFSVTANDGNGGVITITVTITVTPVNQPPVAVDDVYTTLEDRPLIGNVLSNDNDPENNPLTLVKYSINGVTKSPGTYSNIPNIGTIAIVSDGSFTFTPVTDYAGTLPPIAYVVSDGVLTDTANVKITVLPLPEVYKSSGKPVMSSDGTFRWTYTIKLVNDTNQDLDSIQVEDNLDDVFKSKGCTYEVTKVIASGGLIANGLFNGSSVTKTLLEGGTLKINDTDSIEIEVKVNTQGQTDSIVVYNQALYEEILYNQNVSILSDDISIPGTQDPTKTVIPETSLFIPDAFSPNEDGINDKFVIVHPTQMKIEFEVFNRWDNKVFSSKDYQNDWDGKGTSNFLGRELPNGTYYCVYKAINTISGEVVTKGVKYITLRR